MLEGPAEAASDGLDSSQLHAGRRGSISSRRGKHFLSLWFSGACWTNMIRPPFRPIPLWVFEIKLAGVHEIAWACSSVC